MSREKRRKKPRKQQPQLAYSETFSREGSNMQQKLEAPALRLREEVTYSGVPRLLYPVMEQTCLKRLIAGVKAMIQNWGNTGKAVTKTEKLRSQTVVTGHLSGHKTLCSQELICKRETTCDLSYFQFKNF